MTLAATASAGEAVSPPGHWFVGFTKPRQERRTEENLRRQGFDCHLPLIRVQRRGRHELVWLEEAMFPRYVFLRPAIGAAPLDRVRSTFGMSGLVRFAGLPATVAAAVVEQLLLLDSAHREDLFEPGEAVRFVEGPLAGLEGVFERAAGEERAIVLLEFLAREQRVTVPTRQLAGAH